MAIRDCGTWIYDTTLGMGDSTKLLRIDTLNSARLGWGSAVGLGWTPKLRVWKAGDRSAVVATVEGAWDTTAVDPESLAAFAIGDEFSLVPALATDPPIKYHAMIVMLNPSGTELGFVTPNGEADVYAFTVQRCP